MARSALAAVLFGLFLAPYAAANYGGDHAPEETCDPQEFEQHEKPEACGVQKVAAAPGGGFDAGDWTWLAAGVTLGAAGVGALVVTRGLWWPRLRNLGWGAFFARLTRRDVERHPLRARVLDAVAADPGTSVADLAARLQVNAGTLDYHLDILQRDGRLRILKSGRNRLLFTSDAQVDERAMATLSTRTRQHVAVLILQEPGIHAAAIAARLGLQRATVHHHVEQLESSGLVRVERTLRARCFPTDRLATLAAVKRRVPSLDQDHRNT